MKIRELLSDESKWTQRAYARMPDGTPRLFGTVHGAVQWCLVGAVDVCYPLRPEQLSVHNRIREVIGTSGNEWNDDPSRTFADVRALIERLDI